MKDLLNEEIKTEFEELPKVPFGTPEYTAVVTGVTKLIEKAIELEKFEVERQDKLDAQKNQEELETVKIELDKQERENRIYVQEQQLELQKKQFELQERQRKDNIKNNTLQILVAVGTTLLTVGLTVWGTNTTLDFEKEGTVTTSAGRSFLGRLFNKK